MAHYSCSPVVLLALGKDRDMPYVATVNVPGYLPMDDDPPVFDTPAEAWAYLAEERERAESDATEDGLFVASECLSTLRSLAESAPGSVAYASVFTPESDGIGTVYGSTPGYDGTRDLGLAYSVSVAVECEHDRAREKVTCGSCGRSWCDRCNPTHGPRCAFEYDHPAALNEA